MRTLFMGTPDIAVPVLSALLDAGHDVAAVFTQPDRPAGRGRRTSTSPVKKLALEHGLPVFQPASLRGDQVQAELSAVSPDVIVVAAYGLFLPGATLELPSHGCLNVHPSLLPRYRGPSPVAAAILGGDDSSGVTIIRLDERMDSGPIVARRETPIGPYENGLDLTSRLFRMGAHLLVEVLPDWVEGRIRAEPQDESQATTTRLLKREDGAIDWRRDAEGIARQARAYYPWPGAFTRWKGKLLKVIEASGSAGQDVAVEPGRVVPLPDGRLGIVCGDGVLAIRRLQLEGGRAVDAGEFQRGHADFVGSLVGE